MNNKHNEEERMRGQHVWKIQKRARIKLVDRSNMSYVAHSVIHISRDATERIVRQRSSEQEFEYIPTEELWQHGVILG